MPPAARVTDMHTCPMFTGPVPHVGGPILPPGHPMVLIDFLPAATVTNMATCVGPPDVIVKGSAGVFINFLPAARMGDNTAHGGVIIMGSPTCIIGEIGSPSPGAGGMGGVVSGLAASGLPAAANPSKYSKHKKHKGPPPVVIPPECAYLKKGALVTGSPANFDANRRAATVGANTAIKHTFPGGTGPVDATTHTVTIDGHSVGVIEPVGGPTAPGQQLPSSDQITQSLGAVPADQFTYIKEVEVSPQANPADAYWAQQYHMPGFQSEATGGAAGTVTWYPINQNTPLSADETMIHESGHTYSKNIWKTDAEWKPWQDAAKSDGRVPSDYAKTSKDEDFSESLVMYSMSKGTKCEATARALFPARYKMLDDLLKPKVAAPPAEPAAPAGPK